MPSIRELTGVVFRIASTTFGSGPMTVVLLGEQFVRRRWLDRWQVDLYFTLARVLPGTNVFAFVASAAHAIRGWAGTVAALLALSVPASVGVILLTLAYQRWNASPHGGAFITAAICAIVGIILAASWNLAAPRIGPGSRVRTAVLVTGAAVLSPWLSPLTILLIGAAAGYFWPEPDEERS